MLPLATLLYTFATWRTNRQLRRYLRRYLTPYHLIHLGLTVGMHTIVDIYHATNAFKFKRFAS